MGASENVPIAVNWNLDPIAVRLCWSTAVPAHYYCHRIPSAARLEV